MEPSTLEKHFKCFLFVAWLYNESFRFLFQYLFGTIYRIILVGFFFQVICDKVIILYNLILLLFLL